jgi:hypothetical protein
MNGKLLIKAMINEVTDPHLFAYLARIENPRLRAGALKALASAAARADMLSASNANEDGTAMLRREPAPAARATIDSAAPNPMPPTSKPSSAALAPIVSGTTGTTKAVEPARDRVVREQLDDDAVGDFDKFL